MTPVAGSLRRRWVRQWLIDKMRQRINQRGRWRACFRRLFPVWNSSAWGNIHRMIRTSWSYLLLVVAATAAIGSWRCFAATLFLALGRTCRWRKVIEKGVEHLLQLIQAMVLIGTIIDGAHRGRGRWSGQMNILAVHQLSIGEDTKVILRIVNQTMNGIQQPRWTAREQIEWTVWADIADGFLLELVELRQSEATNLRFDLQCWIVLEHIDGRKETLFGLVENIKFNIKSTLRAS